MLQITDLEKSYIGERSLFSPFSIEVSHSQLIQITGPNGAGKTTVLKCIAGFLSLDRGHIIYSKNHNPFTQHDSDKIQRFTSFCAAEADGLFPQLSLENNFNFFKKFYQSDLELKTLFDQFELTPYTSISFQKCSSGIRKRASLARSLIKKAPLLLLDEPFANLDENFNIKLFSILERWTENNKSSIILTSNQALPNLNKNIKIYALSPSK